jgi:hypothetical protein
VLLAARFPQTVAVVTVGANLDTDAWARHAGQDLSDSLNPSMIVAPFPNRVFQRHFAGSHDSVVPTSLSDLSARRLGQPLTIVAGFRHGCCWDTIWPKVLQELDLALKKNR